MTPDDALICLHRDGWRWQISPTYFSDHDPIFSVAGWAPWARDLSKITVFVSSRPDLAEAVDLANAEADRLTAEHPVAA